jgi:hypothetical protein
MLTYPKIKTANSLFLLFSLVMAVVSAETDHRPVVQDVTPAWSSDSPAPGTTLPIFPTHQTTLS